MTKKSLLVTIPTFSVHFSLLEKDEFKRYKFQSSGFKGYLAHFLSPGPKNKKKPPRKKFLIFREMELSDSKNKKFLMFPEMEPSTFQLKLTPKNSPRKNFSHFRKWKRQNISYIF